MSLAALHGLLPRDCRIMGSIGDFGAVKRRVEERMITDTQRTKRALMQIADNAGPGQSARIPGQPLHSHITLLFAYDMSLSLRCV